MTQGFTGGAEATEHRPDIDWEAVERSPEFRELVRRKKAFVLPATLFFMAWYFGFIVLSREVRAERMFDELYVRSETGLGAEGGTGLTLTGRRTGARTAAATTMTMPHP